MRGRERGDRWSLRGGSWRRPLQEADRRRWARKERSARTLIAKKHQDAVFFVAGREKNDPGTDFSDKQVEAAKLVAKGLQAANEEMLNRLLAAGTIQEICNDTPPSQE